MSTRRLLVGGVLVLALVLVWWLLPRLEAPGGVEPVRLDAAVAQRLATETRASLAVTVADGLSLSLWASDALVADPLALDFDDDGQAYVVGSSRSGLHLDIRQHPDWVPIAHTLTTHEDLADFYRRELSRENSAANPWLPDLNEDGVRDWQDLTILTERVYRIADRDGDGVADESQVVFEGFNDGPSYDVAGGILRERGAVVVAAAPGVWRLTDSDADGVLDLRAPVSEGYGVHPAVAGRGLSGPVMGPDGRLYWAVGDAGLSVIDRDGRRHSFADQGAVLRANPDGSEFEVFATGLCRLQAFAFTEYGDLIGVDSGGDHPGETDRVVYVADGTDSGWRTGWQYGKYSDARNNSYNVWMDEGLHASRFEGQSSYIVPPIADFHAGASGSAYEPGTALSDDWRGRFFVSSLTGASATSRIYALDVEPRGAGYAVTREETVLEGVLAPALAFGPDGALYVTDWIEGWQPNGRGRVWKLDVADGEATAVRLDVGRRLATDVGDLPASELRTWLAHADRRVRLKAQFELARRGDAGILESVVRTATDRLARLHGIWGLGQLARRDRNRITSLTSWLTDADAEVRAQAARVIGEAGVPAAAPPLVPLLGDDAPRVRFFAAQALGRLAFAPARGAVVEMLAENDDRDVQLRHAGSLALARMGDAVAIEALASHPSTGVRLAAVVALRRLRAPGVARFLVDADPLVVAEAARAINDDGGIAEARLALAARLMDADGLGEAVVRRAISANLRLGSADAVDRLHAFAAGSLYDDRLRADAIRALATWRSPSLFDRVDGTYLGAVEPRDTAAAQAAVLALARDAAADVPQVKVALAAAVAELGAPAATPLMIAQLASDPSPDVRLASLQTLRVLETGRLSEVAALALADTDGRVRRLGLTLVPDLPLREPEKVRRIMDVFEAGDVPDRQAAVAVLGSLRGSDAEAALTSLFGRLESGRLEAGVQLDVVTAIQGSGFVALRDRLLRVLRERGSGTVGTAFPEALSHGGDATRGEAVFMTDPLAGCGRCHTVGVTGADVGPDLSRVGAKLPRERILEAILEPSAHIEPGFGAVTLTLTSGEVLTGLLRDESEGAVILATGEAAVDRRVPAEDIVTRINVPSTMPAFGSVLEPRDLRDLVEYLASLGE